MHSEDETGGVQGGMVALMVMVVILAFLIIFFCLMPYIKELTRRAKYWEDPANDPRWNKDNFQFSPKIQRKDSGSYQRLGDSLGSSVATDINIGGSFRNVSGLPRDEDQVTINIPTKFTTSLAPPDAEHKC